MKKLESAFYQHHDVVALGRELLGKVLVTNFNDCLTAGIIVENESYKAPEDKASHAYNNRRTKRTETMFAMGGISYIYLCYGIHHLFNIVTGPKDVAHAILVRAIMPVDGIQIMQSRRKLLQAGPRLSNGPGVLTQALGLNKRHNAKCLLTSEIWVEDRGIHVPSKDIVAAPRIGISYAQEFVDKPWRFFIKNNPWVSTYVGK